jgi:hypothetical protein
MEICGIYKITSPSKKVYIGQSVDIYERWQKYQNLNKDRHINHTSFNYLK